VIGFLRLTPQDRVRTGDRKTGKPNYRIRPNTHKSEMCRSSCRNRRPNASRFKSSLPDQSKSIFVFRDLRTYPYASLELCGEKS